MALPSANLEKGHGSPRDLVVLDPDHPGFRDADYRLRRNQIAQIALNHVPSCPVGRVEYTEEEHAVWNQVWETLGPLHEEHACRQLLQLAEGLGLNRERIPQLVDLNRSLKLMSGFRMEPVAGLVQARTFLSFLGRQIFLSTQYIRHPSRPLYTPEPDVVHELIGHAASLTHPGIAMLNEALGGAAQQASDTELLRLERVYWHTLEFGAAEEDGQVKAFGAGLLSSFGEIQRFAKEAELRDWNLAEMAETPYDPTDYQPVIFVAPSFDRLMLDLASWALSGDWWD